MITKFEQLPNELILTCLAYFDLYELNDIFYCLNQRFSKLIQHEIKQNINLTSIPTGKFLTFCNKLNQLLTTSQEYPLSIVADDECKLNLILYDDLFQDKFSKLKSLKLSNTDVETIYSILFDETIKLYQTLERLSLLKGIHNESYYEMDELWKKLISSKMKSLNYLHLNFKPRLCECDYCCERPSRYAYLYFHELGKKEKSSSHLKTIIIGNISYTTTTICFTSLINDLLPCLPELKCLIINSINFEEYDSRQKRNMLSTTTTSSVLPSNLKVIKIWIDNYDISHDAVEKHTNLIRNFFINNNSTDTSTIKIFNIDNKSVL